MKSYGSVNSDGSVSSSSPQHHIHLHPTLEALDAGPHAFRSALPQCQSDSPDTTEQRRLQSMSMPATLNSPLLRRNFSSPGNTMKGKALHQAQDPPLTASSIQNDTSQGVLGGDVVNKNESKLLYCTYSNILNNVFRI